MTLLTDIYEARMFKPRKGIWPGDVNPNWTGDEIEDSLRDAVKQKNIQKAKAIVWSHFPKMKFGELTSLIKDYWGDWLDMVRRGK